MRKPGDLVTKDPSSDEPYGFDWTAWLAELGIATIATSTWVITGTGLTKHDETVVSGNFKTQAFFAAGTAGVKYTVTNRVVTNSSPPVTDERSFQVLVSNR